MNSFVKMFSAITLGVVIGLSVPKAKASEFSDKSMCELHAFIAYRIMTERQNGTPRSEVEAVVSSSIGKEMINQAYDSEFVSKKKVKQEAEKFSNKFEKICIANEKDGVAI